MVSISSGSGSRQRITAGCLRFLLVEFLQVRLRVVYAILEDLDWESSGGFAQKLCGFLYHSTMQARVAVRLDGTAKCRSYMFIDLIALRCMP